MTIRPLLPLILLFGTLSFKIQLAQQYITEDAKGFAKIFRENPDSMSADIIKSDYLKPSTPGIKIFTPMRIRNAEHMASMVNKYHKTYEKGVNLI